MFRILSVTRLHTYYAPGTVMSNCACARRGLRGYAHTYVHRPYNMQDKAAHETIAQLSGLKAAMLASSVQAVVATALRVCTLAYGKSMLM